MGSLNDYAREQRSIAGRAKRGLVHFEVSNVQSLARDSGGRFVSFQRIIARLNAILAEELAKAVVDAVDRYRLASRREATTGVLEKALTNPQARFSDAFGFGVGVIAWLNASDAPYWRLQNDGTAKFRGRPITFIKVPGGGFPDSHGGALRMVKNRDESGKFTQVKAVTTIKRPIPAMHYFEHALADFDLRAKTLVAYRQALREAGYTNRQIEVRIAVV